MQDAPCADVSVLCSCRFFNPVQSECFEVACRSDTNMVSTSASKQQFHLLTQPLALVMRMPASVPTTHRMLAILPTQHGAVIVHTYA